MAKSFYIPSTSKYNRDDSSSSSGKSSKSGFYTPSTKGYADRYAEQQKQEEEQKLFQAQEQAKQPSPGINLGDVGKGLWEGITSAYNRTGQGLSEIVANATGVREQERKQYEQSQAESQQLLLTAIKKSKETTDPAKKKQWEDIANNISTTKQKQSEEFNKTQADIIDRADAVKNTAALAEIGLDITTLGTGGRALKAGKLAVGGGKVAEKSLPRLIASGAVQGAAAGGLSAVEQKGQDVTLGDIGTNAAIGGALGGAIPSAVLLKKIKPVAQADKFVSDSLKKAYSSVAETTVGKKVGDFTEKVTVAFQDKLAPIYRDFKGKVDTASGREVNDEIRVLSGNVLNSSSITNAQLKENKGYQGIKELFAPQSTVPGGTRIARKEAEEAGKFISEKQQVINWNKVNPDKPPKEIPIGTPKQEQAYQLLNQATKDDIQRAYDAQLITEANYNKYMADTDYTRVQKNLEDEIKPVFTGATGPNASISESIVKRQKLKGSTKESIDPFTSYVDWSDKITKEVQRQKLSSYIIGKREEFGLGKGFLRTADNVEASMAARGEAAQTRVLRNKLSSIIKTESRFARRLQSELDKLNQKGLNVALKTGGKTSMQDVATSQISKLSKVKGKTSNTKAVIKSLVEADVSQLTAIKKKIANREPKLASQLDNIIIAKQQHEIAANEVRNLAKIAAENADKEMTGKFTISTLNRGIREVYEDDPRIVNAIKNTGAIQQHAIIRVLQAPSRAVQRFSTGLNFVFSLPNFGKDQIDSMILSKNANATHSPVAFMMGLKEAIAKPLAKSTLETIGLKNIAKKLSPSKEYEQFLKYIAGSTRTDINRARKDVTKRAYEALGLRKDNLVGKIENINTATENATRFQNFFGTLQDNYKKGMDNETALKNAIQAGRENSVDFGPSGDWAPILKIANPFANANIQGSRSLARAFRDRPLSTSAKLATTVLAPVAASTYYNLSDPKRAMIYDAIPDYEKQSNLIFITDSGDVVKLPLPAGVKQLAAPVRGMVEAEYGMGEPVTFQETAKAIFDTFEPIPLDATAITPLAARPLIENQMNKSFFTGNEIVPDYLKNLDPKEQVFSKTSQTYRDIADKFGMSPLQVKNILQGYGSSVGEQGISLFDQLRKASVTATKGEEAGNKIVTSDRNTVQQMQKRFFSESPDLEKKATSVFYEAYSPLRSKRDKVYTEVRNLKIQGKFNEAKRRAEDFNKTLDGKFSSEYSEYWTDDMKDLATGLRINPDFKVKIK